MDDMFIWILVGVGIFLILIPFILGMMLPAQKQATRVELIKAPPEDVWEMLSELSRQTEWRTDLKSVQLKDDDDGMRWVENSTHGGSIVVRKLKEVTRKEIVMQMEQGKRVVGTRQAVLNPVPGGTRVTFTETSRINNPIGRLKAQFGEGLDKRLNTYISQFKQKLVG